MKLRINEVDGLIHITKSTGDGAQELVVVLEDTFTEIKIDNHRARVIILPKE